MQGLNGRVVEFNNGITAGMYVSGGSGDVEFFVIYSDAVDRVVVNDNFSYRFP